jgi:uncharacterized protein (TIGR03066 family)
MKSIRIAVAMLALIGIAVSLTHAQEKKDVDKAKIVGKWKVIKAEGVPPGTIVEFSKDGKLKISIEADGMKLELSGTYKVEGDKLQTALKVGDKEEKDEDTIKTLTDDKLSIIDKDGKGAELERAK